MPGWGFSMRLLITTILMMCLVQETFAASEGMIDPTKPPSEVMEYFPNAQTQLEQPWEISAIQENGQSGFAVVNGQMVQVGGSYEGFKLTSVKNRKAVFIGHGGEKKVIGMGLSSFIEQTTPTDSVKKTKSSQQIKKHKVKK
jgi:hypothetical protein